MALRDKISLTVAAREKILALCADLKAQRGVAEVIPALGWLDSNMNQGKFTSRPIVGFYFDRAEVGGGTVMIDGLEFVLGVTPEDEHNLVGVIDFDGSQLVVKKRGDE